MCRRGTAPRFFGPVLATIRARVEPERGQCQASRLTYVLVTPARNERDLIEGTIRSVIAQTHLPSKWVIVSDGSTDGTDELVDRFAKEHAWIELLRMPEHRDRSFRRQGSLLQYRLRPLEVDELRPDRQSGCRHYVRPRLS